MQLRVTKTVLSFCAAAFTTLAFHGAAEAAYIEYSHSFTADEEIYFPYYDPLTGTLTDVTYWFTSQFDVSLEGTATSPPPNKTYTVKSDHDFLIDGTTVLSVTLTATCTTGAKGTSCTATDQSENVTLDLDLAGLLKLSDFEGVGTFGPTFSTITTAGGDCLDKASCVASTMWAGTAYLTYTFDENSDPGPLPPPVPAPTTLLLFGIGLAGLGFLLRRRKRGWRG